MPANTRISSSNGTSEAAIFSRLWETEGGKLPRTLARQLLKLGFSEADKERMHELAVKNQGGQISAKELEELDHFVRAGDFLVLLQSKARKTLNQKKASPPRHG